MDRSQQNQQTDKWLRKVKTPLPKKLYHLKKEKSKAYRHDERLSNTKSSELPRQAFVRKRTHVEDQIAQNSLKNYVTVRKRARIIGIVDSDEEERAMFITQLPKGKGKKDHKHDEKGHKSSESRKLSSLRVQQEKNYPDTMSKINKAISNNSAITNVVESTDDDRSLFITQVPRPRATSSQSVAKAPDMKDKDCWHRDPKSKKDTGKSANFCVSDGQGNGPIHSAQIKQTKEPEKTDLPQHHTERAESLGSPVVTRMMQQRISKDTETDIKEPLVTFLYLFPNDPI